VADTEQVAAPHPNPLTLTLSPLREERNGERERGHLDFRNGSTATAAAPMAFPDRPATDVRGPHESVGERSSPEA